MSKKTQHTFDLKNPTELGSSGKSHKLLDFFIVGTQKGGTTALYSKISSHPDIYRHAKKELHFFDRDQINWETLDSAPLHAFYAQVNPLLLWGDATPVYMYWPKSIARIKNYNPKAKIIIILRHPARRALSHWKLERIRNQETLSFEDAISDKGRNRYVNTKTGVHRVFSYVERGLYAEQIQNVLKHFPKNQVFFTTDDDLKSNELGLLKQVFSFLGVENSWKDFGKRQFIRPVDSSGVPFDDWDSVNKLTHFFQSDILRTSELTGLNLDHWLEG